MFGSLWKYWTPWRSILMFYVKGLEDLVRDRDYVWSSEVESNHRYISYLEIALLEYKASPKSNISNPRKIHCTLKSSKWGLRSYPRLVSLGRLTRMWRILLTYRGPNISFQTEIPHGDFILIFIIAFRPTTFLASARLRRNWCNTTLSLALSCIDPELKPFTVTDLALFRGRKATN